MNKVHVIVNPFSARGQTEKRWETIKAAIRSHFREFKYVFTEKPRQATDIARELLQQGFDLLIGVGGDGTLNEISNGFFHAQSGQAINGDAAVGIIPSGTGSDFIRFMKVPREFEKSAAHIKNSANKKIDIGKNNLRRRPGRKQNAIFHQCGRFRPGGGSDPQDIQRQIRPARRFHLLSRPALHA